MAGLIRLPHAMARMIPRRQALAPASGVVIDAVPFQTDLDEIIEEHASRMLRAPIYAIAGLIGTLVVVAVLVRIDTVVPANGQLMTDAPPIVLQPMERGIIRQVSVKPGQEVHKGQVLATLDPTFTQADLQSLTAKQHLLAVRMRRIQAELDDKPFAPTAEEGDDGLLQATLYTESRGQLRSKLSSLDEQIAEAVVSHRSTQANIASLSKQVTVAQGVASIRSDLYQAQVGSKLQLLDSLSSRITTERAYQDAVNHLDELQHQIAAKQAERQAVLDGWRHDLMESQVRDRTDMNAIAEQLVKARHMSDLVNITAPQDGVVLEVADRSAGSVMREAEPLVTIMPNNVPLIADVMVDSAEIGELQPGAPVQIKVAAFPYARHGVVHGRLRAISQENFVANGRGSAESSGKGLNSGPAFHRAQIEITDDALHNLPKDARLMPGMTVAADIKTGNRRLISYFLTPVLHGFDESFREPQQ